MAEEPRIEEHIEDVHGIEGGIETLKPMQVIEVDTKIAFTLPSLLEMELLGPDKRATLIKSVYILCEARNVITKTTNKNHADLNMS